MPPGSARGLVCSKAEAQLDGLSVDGGSQIYHRVDVAPRWARPRHAPSQRVLCVPADFPGVAAAHKTPPHRWIGYVGEVSIIYVGRGYFQHSPIPVYPTTKFRVEIVPETQHRRIATNGNVPAVHNLVADSILVGDECVIGRAIRTIGRGHKHDSITGNRI